MRPANVLVAVLALTALTARPSRGEEPKPADPEEKLLRAQLLEVSTGEIEKAVAAYEAIRADEKAPPAVRARATLYLARSERKRGQVDSARKLLEGLVADRALDREVRRQAESFLRELTGGK